MINMGVIRNLINSQQNLSFWFDKCLPAEYQIRGAVDFTKKMVPQYVLPGMLVYDVGGGKRPFFSVTERLSLNIKVIGFDISAEELAAAPANSYDAIICSDVTRYSGGGDADLVVCCTLLEHVRDTNKALRAIASMLRDNGTALVFLPSRNAIFARLNLLLPEALKRWVLFGLFPEKSGSQGFPSFYDGCTPSGIREMCEAHGLSVVEERYYFRSTYFSFFFPLYVLWRFWILFFRALMGNEAAETFAFALRKTHKKNHISSQ